MHAPTFPLRRPAFLVTAARRPVDLRPKLRLLALILVVAALLAGGWFALRDSSLVAVKDVEVSGVSGPQRAAIREALTQAGQDMTTLHVRQGALTSAVEPYAIVRDVVARSHFPHRLQIRVIQHVPVAVAVTPSGSVPLAADGTILKGADASDVPALKLRLPPAGLRVTDRQTLQTIALLARAPAPLRDKVTSAFRGPSGLTVRLANGPAVHFGSAERIAAKWASLSVVLASPRSRGATAIDVRVPEHPAAAGLEQASVQTGEPSTGG